METLHFRDLEADEIEVRVGSTTRDDNGKVIAFGLLLYKTARVDANILDETLGVYGWQKKFYQVKNTMVCSIGLYNEQRQEWIWKDDGGDDDFTTEQVKAELSDSFKRAGFCIGIGRKLYSASKIYMRVEKTKDNTEKSFYQVKEIEYDDTSITKLVIINKKTKETVISYGCGKQATKTSETNYKQALKDNVSKLPTEKYVGFTNWLSENYNVRSIDNLSEQQAEKVLKTLFAKRG